MLWNQTGLLIIHGSIEYGGPILLYAKLKNKEVSEQHGLYWFRRMGHTPVVRYACWRVYRDFRARGQG